MAGLLALALGCSGGPPKGRVVEVARQDLVVDVEVTGTLKAIDSDSVGPPGVLDTWEFKIVRMAPEGGRVKAGAEVLAFDTSDLDKKLKEYESEVAAITEELGKTRSERALTGLASRLESAEADAKRRKAELKADKPVDLTAELTLKTAAIERDLARREVSFKDQQARSRAAQGAADLAALENRLARARRRVDEIKAAIAMMAVKARRPGTVVYKQDFRGEKKKVGDGLWRGESVLEIASLDKMAAQGQVDEVDASQVATGQRVGLRLEAHPDKEYGGAVERVAPLVQTESVESRVKVVLLDIRLDATDALLMRPGMRFRGRIEVSRAPGVLQVPLAAVHATPAGPTVVKADGQRASVTLGRRSREAVEITGGLREGDRVLLQAPAAPKEKSSSMPMGAS